MPIAVNEADHTLPSADDLERLHDLHWKISDSAWRYRDLLDAQAGLIVRRDAEARVVFANRAYLAAFGLSEEDISGQVHEPRVLAAESIHRSRVAGLEQRHVEILHQLGHRQPEIVAHRENELDAMPVGLSQRRHEIAVEFPVPPVSQPLLELVDHDQELSLRR